MSKNSKIMVLNLPSPPYLDVGRDWAGGFGTVTFSLRRALSWRRGDYGQGRSPILQPFLPYTSSVLSEAGYEFKVLDCQRARLNQYQCLVNVKHENPDFLIALIGLPSLENDLALLNEIKRCLPNTFIIGVGTTCRVIPNEVLLKSSVDAVLRNSYPYVSNLIDLIQAQHQGRDLRMVHGVSYWADGKVVSTPESPELNLGEMPSPSYDALELDGYDSFHDINGEQYRYISILGSKGCPYPCIYCPYPVGFGRKWDRRSPESIVDEMEFLNATRDIRGFLFRDQSFAMNKKHAFKVCDEIIRRKLDIAWYCEARVNEVSRELLEKMKESGCKRVHYGVETGDPKLIKIGKPGISIGTIRKAFSVTKEIGLWANAHVILGLPDETPETLERTRKFVEDLDPHGTNWNVLTPYPGTKLYEMARRNSWILTYDWSRYTSHTLVMRTKKLSQSQLYAIIQRVIRKYSKQRIKKILLEIPRRKAQPIFLTKELLHFIALYAQNPIDT